MHSNRTMTYDQGNEIYRANELSLDIFGTDALGEHYDFQPVHLPNQT